ncbi:MAG: ATP-binding cassette domain-containing protein, partial [Caldilinea sp.]
MNLPPSPEPLLAVQDLTVGYRTRTAQVQALRNVSLTLNPGETLGIVGESGCGK